MLAFLHIPKTAGTALIWSVERALGPERVFRIGTHCTVDEWAEGRIGRARLAGRLVVAGHTTADAIGRIGPSMRVTMVREPVERVASHYQYILTKRVGDRLWKRLKGKTLIEALAVPVFRHMSSNDQCRRFAGGETADAALARMAAEGWIAYPSHQVDELLGHVSSHFGWSLQPVGRANAADEGYLDRVLTDEAREAILALNGEDMKLWQMIQSQPGQRPYSQPMPSPSPSSR